MKAIVSQLSKYLKFKSIRGDKNDCILYKITPRNVTNFRHLLNCDTIATSLKQIDEAAANLQISIQKVGQVNSVRP